MYSLAVVSNHSSTEVLISYPEEKVIDQRVGNPVLEEWMQF